MIGTRGDISYASNTIYWWSVYVLHALRAPYDAYEHARGRVHIDQARLANEITFFFL